MIRCTAFRLLLGVVSVGICVPPVGAGEQIEDPWPLAEGRAALNREALQRVDRVLDAWLERINPETGLAPQNYDENKAWTVANSAADLYSSLVLDAAHVNHEALEGTLKRALDTEAKRAERIGHMPDDLFIESLMFVYPEPSLARCQYGSSEWCRDGLLRITEALGPSTPWFQRMVVLVEEIMQRADRETRFGALPGNIEICGEMLQTLSRLHAITGEQKYRAWAERIGDYYLFENPPHRLEKLRLRDHGGEITSGLAELYAMAHRADPQKARRYEEPLRDMLDRVVEVGQMSDGTFANIINPRDGEVISVGLYDPKEGVNTNWGYLCNAHATYDMVRGSDRYGDRIRKALAALPKRFNDREDFEPAFYSGSSDYFADFLENAMVLYRRYPVDGVETWVARTIPLMWAFQKDDGTVNRHYHDGSFGRTSVLFARMCSRGVVAEAWRDDLGLGAVEYEGTLYVVLRVERPWTGRLRFDSSRWREQLHLPVDYPRINELTEWYTVERSDRYELIIGDEDPRSVTGTVLIDGLPVQLRGGQALRIVVRPR